METQPLPPPQQARTPARVRRSQGYRAAHSEPPPGAWNLSSAVFGHCVCPPGPASIRAPTRLRPLRTSPLPSHAFAVAVARRACLNEPCRPPHEPPSRIPRGACTPTDIAQGAVTPPWDLATRGSPGTVVRPPAACCWLLARCDPSSRHPCRLCAAALLHAAACTLIRAARRSAASPRRRRALSLAGGPAVNPGLIPVPVRDNNYDYYTLQHGNDSSRTYTHARAHIPGPLLRVPAIRPPHPSPVFVSPVHAYLISHSSIASLRSGSVSSHIIIFFIVSFSAMFSAYV